MHRIGLPSRSHLNPSNQGNASTVANGEDSKLCNKILQIDPAIRAVAVVQGAAVSGFASSPRSTGVLGESQFREKLGFWVRIVTEIARQVEPLFGRLETISFAHDKLRLVTMPLSPDRSLGFSLEKSADLNYVIHKISSRLDQQNLDL